MSSTKIPKNPEHRREWIKYQLKLNKSSYASIARDHDVTRQAVQLVNYQHLPRWEAIIAQVIGRKPEAIWPERYAA